MIKMYEVATRGVHSDHTKFRVAMSEKCQLCGAKKEKNGAKEIIILMGTTRKHPQQAVEAQSTTPHEFQLVHRDSQGRNNSHSRGIYVHVTDGGVFYRHLDGQMSFAGLLGFAIDV